MRHLWREVDTAVGVALRQASILHRPGRCHHPTGMDHLRGQHHHRHGHRRLRVMVTQHKHRPMDIKVRPKAPIGPHLREAG